jgi:hypothetical protein
MKTIANRLTFFAAAAVVLGTMAYGQTRSMKVEIPFDFRTSAGKLPAGVYWVTEESSGGGMNHAFLNNAATKHPVIILGSQHDYLAEGSAAMLFRCGAEGCALSGIRTSNGTTVYNPGRLSKRDQEVAILATPTHSVKAD